MHGNRRFLSASVTALALLACSVAATKVQKHVAGASKEVADAQAILEKATYDLNIAVQQKTTSFNDSAELKAAKKAVVDAQAEVKTTRAAVMDKLKRDPTYTALTAREAAAQAQVDKLKADNTDPAAITSASQEALRLGGQTSTMERTALDADPTYKTASDKLVTANATLTQMQDNFKQSLVNDPNLSSLRKAKADADLHLSEAKAKLTSDESLLKHH